MVFLEEKKVTMKIRPQISSDIVRANKYISTELRNVLDAWKFQYFTASCIIISIIHW